MKRLFLGLVCALLCACHTPVTASTPSTLQSATWSDAVRTRRIENAPKPTRTPSTYVSADDCEVAAREWIPVDADFAWKRLIGCVTRPDFADLRRLLRSPWLEVVRTRPDAAMVLAKVIATRGGQVNDDLTLLRRARIPLFPFASAIATPEVYSGRLLLVRGRVVEGRMSDGGAEVFVEQTVLRARVFDRQQENMVQENQSSLEEGRLGSRRETRLRYERKAAQIQAVDVEHYSKPTGRSLMARLDRADPFLVHGRDFVFLVRFGGAAPRGDDDAAAGIGDIVAFYEASRLRVD